MAKKSVPVANRTTAKRTVRVAVPRVRLSGRELAIVGIVLVVVIAIVGTPLRNYLQQRSEIQRLSAAISEKEAEKDRLQSEIDKYNSPAYVKEQARERLGVIDPGEVAYRVLGQSTQSSSADSSVQDQASTKPWYETLWDSVSVAEIIPQEMPSADSTNNLPIVPTPTP